MKNRRWRCSKAAQGSSRPHPRGLARRHRLASYIVAEELGKHCLSTAVTIAIHTSLSAMSILDVGTEEQKQKYLPAMAAGETIGAFALTEPDAGSDPGSLTTRADKSDRRSGGYRLNRSRIG